MSRSAISPVHRPITVLMLLVAALVVGVVAFRSIPLQLIPPGVTTRSISVRVPVRDSTPTEVMETVAAPVEEMFRTIQGVLEIRSWSRSNSCSVRVSYGSGADGDAIYADIRDRMERLVPSLPEGADRYRIFRFNIETDIPVVELATAYDDSVENPDALIENVIQRHVEGIDGVARADVFGLLRREIAIELDPDLVEAYHIDLRDLVRRLAEDNLMAPGGVIREGGGATCCASPGASTISIRCAPIRSTHR